MSSGNLEQFGFRRRGRHRVSFRVSSGEGRGAFFDAPPAVAEPLYTTQHRLLPTRPQAGAAATRSSCTSRRMRRCRPRPPCRCWSHQGAAEPLHKRRLMIVEKALGSTHPDLAVALNNLALLYQRSRDFRCSVHFRHPCLCPAVLDMRRTSYRLKPGTWTPRFSRL
jgi:hypothetical protein